MSSVDEEESDTGIALAVLHPVLCAALADEGAHERLAAIAAARGTVILPLLDAPVDTAVHVLEITTRGQPKPLVVFAEPLGPPGEHGFPLRLHPYDAPAPEGLRVPRPLPPDTPHFGAARPKRTTLTDRHSRDLSGEHDTLDSRDLLEGRAEALVGRDIASGKLVIEALVGIGGMGVVYRARHRQLGMDIAVKILHERYRADVAFSARFHAEALAVSQLDHPNVVRIVDYGQEPDGLLYLAMDFLRGEELETILEREGALAHPRVIEIGMQVAAGLGHAHARGIVHRDVKPSNLVLVPGEDDEGNPIAVVKICDFGIAIREGSGDHLGTPAYMSPEQCAHERVDARSDVYSLGVILYELATGRLPFSGSAEETLRKHVSEMPAPPSSIAPIDPRLERTILEMMSKSAEARPQTMRAVRHALREVSRPVETPGLSLHDVGASRREREREADPPSDNRPAPHTSVDGMAAPVDPQALARALVAEPVSTVRERLVSLEALVAAARPLALALRVLLDEGELAAFTEATLVLRRVVADHGADPRAELAARILRSLHDPSLFSRAAERALVSDDEVAGAALATVGVAGAHALYAARLRVQPTPAVRGRFVTTLRAMGPASAALLEAALDRNAPGDSQEHDQRLAEDLLRALTPAPSDAIGVTLARYLRWGAASVRRASVPALVAAWGERARAMLLGVLSKDPDEPTRVVAVKGLRELGGIDEHVVRRAREALASPGCGPGLEGAIAEMLLEAAADARPFAADVLKGVLTPKGGIPALVRAKGAAAVGFVLTAARGYVELAPGEGAAFVEELARSCEEPLRTQLHGLLGRTSDAAPSSRAPHSVAKR